MDPEYLRSCSHGMVEAIKEGDPDGVWLHFGRALPGGNGAGGLV